MLFKASSLAGHRIEARDGSVGTLADLLFDDRQWRGGEEQPRVPRRA
jgi:hypothetical protein